MSGNSDRLINTMPTTIRVKDFNDTSGPAATLGFNSDSRPELYIPNMPSDLVLLYAVDYTQSGATILFPNEGFVLALSPAEKQYLRTYAQDKPIIKELIVRNNTYRNSQWKIHRSARRTSKDCRRADFAYHFAGDEDEEDEEGDITLFGGKNRKKNVKKKRHASLDKEKKMLRKQKKKKLPSFKHLSHFSLIL
jgi:hypothetical protein